MIELRTVTTLAAEIIKRQGVGRWTAVAAVDREIVRSILQHPVAYAVTTLPLFYRGLWIDSFVIVGIPVFFWMLGRALRQRNMMLVALLSTGLFNQVFYALISLNTPRYQITAMPAVALAAASASALLLGRMQVGIPVAASEKGG